MIYEEVIKSSIRDLFVIFHPVWKKLRKYTMCGFEYKLHFGKLRLLILLICGSLTLGKIFEILIQFYFVLFLR